MRIHLPGFHLSTQQWGQSVGRRPACSVVAGIADIVQVIITGTIIVGRERTGNTSMVKRQVPHEAIGEIGRIIRRGNVGRTSGELERRATRLDEKRPRDRDLFSQNKVNGLNYLVKG